MNIVELKSVQYSYYFGQPVLKKISMALEEGKMYVLFGPSGCGKTTLLSLIGGLDVPQDGEILFKGQDIQKTGLTAHRRDNVAFVFQNYNLIEYMTAIENVQLTAKEPPLPILTQLGITEEEAKRNVLKLSGGQQQRVALARALASGAPVILADEPTGNLDEENAREVTRLFKENAHRLNKCVLVVSHSREMADQADVLFELKDGFI